jgi:SAM-dependent methyltransferase
MISTLVSVVYIFFILGIFLIATWLCFSLIKLVQGEAPFVPVMDHALDQIVSELELNNDSYFLELGCGDGKVLIAATKLFPKTTMVGIERSLIPYLIAKWKTRNLKNVTIIRGDIFDYNPSSATHVYTYLFPVIMDRLLPHLEHYVHNGTKLVSCDFAFTKKQPLRSVQIHHPDRSGLARKLHIYKF